MATPVWNQLAAPNYSAANGLIAQAMSQLTKAGEGLQGVAKEYKDTIQKRNLGLIQEYINSAKTPEELQSEGFQTGLAKLTENMRGEYDTSAKAQLVNKATDTLLSRKANQVSIARNEFGLDQDRLTAKKAQNAAELYALRDKPSEFEAAIQRQTAEGALDINAAQSILLNVLNLANATIDNRVKRETADSVIASALLDPTVKQTGIDTALGNLEVARQNAQTNKLQAEAAAAKAEAERKAKQNEKNPALLLLSGIDKIDKTYNSEKLKPDNNPNAANTLTDWWNKNNSWALADTDLDNIKNIIETDPKTSKLSGKEKVFLAETSFQAIKNENTLGRNILSTGGNRKQAEEAVKKAYSDMSTRDADYLYSQKIPLYRDAVRQQMIQTGTRDPVEAARNVGMDEYEMYRTNIRTRLQSMAESLYESSGSTLPKEQFVDKFIYRSVNKEPVDDLIKPKQEAANVPAQSSLTVLNTLGTGSYEDKVAMLGSELKKTRDPIQIAFLESELKKAEQSKPVVQAAATATSPQSKTGNPLQQTALPPNVNKLISTPLDIVTNPSTIKTKPVADPLRQAALEQPPVATNNTSQPRQLTPTEIAQRERMQQTALSNLIGAKLEEKQALVRNTFPNASLTPINKPNEPLSNNSIPLIQSMFKLPVATDNTAQPKSINKAATAEAKEVKQSVFTDTPLKVLANAVKPVPSPLVPVESQNAFKSRDNNLSINLSTGKSVPSKDPVPMPNVSWGKPAEVVTMNPMVAKLPQYKAVATFVGDGDTFKATSKQYATKGTKANGSVLCRVDSVDAPETPHPPYKKGQPYGEEAAKKLQQMILNKEISIRIVKAANGDPNEPGLYGRDICQIEVEGANVSTELIRAGAAWLYREYNNYFTGLETVEANAKAEGRGLFSNPNAVYPPTAKHNGSLNLR